MRNYPASLKFIHWSLTILVVTQLSLILLSRMLSSIEMMAVIYNIHITMGVTTFLLIAARIALAPVARPPKLSSQTPGWQRVAATIAHTTMYGVIGIQCIIGLLITWTSGRTAKIFGAIPLPNLVAENTDTAFALIGVHFYMAVILLSFIGVHIAAVVFNHRVRKEKVLSAIIPRPDAHRFVNRVPISIQITACIGIMLAVCSLGAHYAVKGIDKTTAAGLEMYDKVTQSISHARSAQAQYYKLQELLNRNGGDIRAADAREIYDTIQSDMDVVTNALLSPSINDETRALTTKLFDAAQSDDAMARLKALEEDFEYLAQSVAGEGFMRRLNAETEAATRKDTMIVAIIPGITLLAILLACVLAFSVLYSFNKAKLLAQKIARGDYSSDVEVVGGGESAAMVRALMDMQQSIVAAQDEQERAHQERQEERTQTMEMLRNALGDVVYAAAKGDFEQRVTTEFEEPILNDLAQGLNTILDTVQNAIDDTTTVMSALANADLSARFNGDYHGTLKRLQRSVNHTAEKLEGIISQMQVIIGEVKHTALAGDFSQRVDTDFREEIISDLASSLNSILENVESGVGETSKVMTAIANADLTTRMDGDFSGTFSVLKKNVNDTSNNLTEIVYHLKSVSTKINRSSKEMISGAKTLSNRAAQEAASIEETNAALVELTELVTKNSQRAENANEKSIESKQLAVEGGSHMSKTTAAMEKMVESSQEIFSVVDLIDSIAFQTNILSLNASVEAARAGSAGMGFAVVANEVRSLAQSTQEASQHVRSLIEKSQEDVNASVELVSLVGDSLSKIVATTSDASEELESIVRDNAAGNDSVREVQSAMNNISDSTLKNTSLAEDMHKNIRHISENFETLNKLTKNFRIRLDEEPQGSAEASPTASSAA